MASFDIKKLRERMETDEMELDTIGDRKTALFCIVSDTDEFLLTKQRRSRVQRELNANPPAASLSRKSFDRFPAFSMPGIREKGGRTLAIPREILPEQYAGLL